MGFNSAFKGLRVNHPAVSNVALIIIIIIIKITLEPATKVRESGKVVLFL